VRGPQDRMNAYLGPRRSDVICGDDRAHSGYWHLADKDEVPAFASSPGFALQVRRPRREPRALTSDCSERWRVVEVATAFGLPLPTLTPFAVAALAGPLDLGCGPLERGADLVGLDLGD
jgi:hypothetical protein